MATTLADENWHFMLKLLPARWEELARETGAVTRLRGFDSVEQLLRGLLLHVALGCSLRETVVVAKAAGWLEMSDVALLKKLRQSERWLQTLCMELLREGELELPNQPGMKMRLIDGTLVKEPGQTGSQWRVHFSLRVPEWTCDYFRLTSTEGAGNGESLRQFPVRANDCLIADRGYAHAAGIWHVHQKGGFVIVRHNAQTLPVEEEERHRRGSASLAAHVDAGGRGGEPHRLRAHRKRSTRRGAALRGAQKRRGDCGHRTQIAPARPTHGPAA